MDSYLKELRKLLIWDINKSSQDFDKILKDKYMKDKKSVGRPKSEKPKIRCTFRLDADVVDLIRSKPNQAKYIELIVLLDNNIVTK